MDDLINTFKAIKAIDWAHGAIVSFFIVKRKLVQRDAKYDIFFVNIHDPLKKKLREIFSKKIATFEKVIEYDFNTADLDNDLLGLPTADTDLLKFLNKLQESTELQKVERYEQLLDSWLYIARLDVNGHPSLFFARRISEGWTTKKVTQPIINLIFQDNMLADLNRKDILRIDENVDFFTHGKFIFIANKKNFETALNFRKIMEDNRDRIVAEFSSLRLFEDASTISDIVGNNLRLLRKLSQVEKAGYYKDINFLTNLRKVSDENGWGIEYSSNGKIIVNNNNIETVFRVFNNDRLTSKINSENFDVDVKHKLGNGR